MYSLYAPIEGLLWDLAAVVHKEKQIFDNTTKDQKHFVDIETGDVFESTRIRDVLERTALSEYVDIAFIRDFCDDIYEERNPILHGRKVCFSNCDRNNICLMQKLMALEYLLDILTSTVEKQIFAQFDNMPDDVVDRILNTFESKDTDG